MLIASNVGCNLALTVAYVTLESGRGREAATGTSTTNEPNTGQAGYGNEQNSCR